MCFNSYYQSGWFNNLSVATGATCRGATTPLVLSASAEKGFFFNPSLRPRENGLFQLRNGAGDFSFQGLIQL